MTAPERRPTPDLGAVDGIIASSGDLIEHLAQAVRALHGLTALSRIARLGPLTISVTLHGTDDAGDILDALPSIQPRSQQATLRAQRVDLAINVIDGVRCGVARPRLTWQASDFGFKRRVPGWSDQDRTTYFLRSEGGLSVADWKSGRAYVWVPSIEVLAEHQRAAPFRWLIDGLARQCDLMTVHAAVIGEQGVGLLIVGEGGRGKSTLALVAVAAGMDYLSDDYCLLEPRLPFRAYRLFDTAKLRVNDGVPLELIAKLEPVVKPVDGGKQIFNLARDVPARLVDQLEIRALLIPEFSNDALAIIEKASAKEAFRRAAPSTVTQCEGSERRTAADIAHLARILPCYRIHMPQERRQSIEQIKMLMQSLRSPPPEAAITSPGE